MGSGRKVAGRTPAAERLEILAELERSGLTLREFAARRGIAAGTVSYWRHAENKRARGAGPQRESPGGGGAARFVELSIADAPPREGEPDGSFALRLRDGREVTIPSGFDAAALARLLRVLEAPC